MIKIGDFSKLSRVSVKTLRYYDDVNLLKPARTDQFTGYRYYTAQQLPRLNRILALKDLGFSLEQVARLLDEDLPPAQLRGMLRMKRSEVQQQMEEAQARLARVETRLSQIEREGMMPVEAQAVAILRNRIPTMAGLGKLFQEMYAEVIRHDAHPSGPPFFVWHDDEYRDHDIAVEAGIPITTPWKDEGRVVCRELCAVDTMACVVYHGAFESGGEAYAAVLTWIADNRWRIVGSCRHVVLSFDRDAPPASYVSEIQFPVDAPSR